MIPQFGNLALSFACGLSFLLIILPVIGIQKNNLTIMRSSIPLAYALFVSLTIAEILLITCFVQNDFSVLYVAKHSNTQLPFYYRIAASWGAHEGSLLLWSFLMACWTLALTFSRHQIDFKATSLVLSIMGFINLGFLLFIVFTSNPFTLALVPPIEGSDLNPLLQDIGLIFHPPLLYMGYVGFSIAFAFAVAALIMGRFDTQWIRWFKPWVLVAWIFLTLGILLGSAWAYRELGWGWWSWDPVENSSLMPWLMGTALLHSIIVSEKRGTFKLWTLLLAISTFSLCLIGAFIVRSGILVSVHAFSSDPERGVSILVFLTLVIGCSFLLFALKGHTMISRQKNQLFLSKETFIMIGNLLLLAAVTCVFIGTLYPLFYKQIWLESISIGTPFFNSMFYWLMIPFAFILGVTPLLHWGLDNPKRFIRIILVAAVMSSVILSAIALVQLDFDSLNNKISWAHLISQLVVIWIILLTLYSLCLRFDLQQPFWKQLRAINAGHWGMILGHMGCAMLIFGASFSHYYQIERTVSIQVGETLPVGTYNFTFKAISAVQGANYHGAMGMFEVSKNNQLLTTLWPEKRLYTTSKMPMVEVAIQTSLTGDFYATLNEQVDAKNWVVKLAYKPFMVWIWLGGFCMALGGMFAIFNKRQANYTSTKRKGSS